jgi:hypothetical protein
MQQQQFKVSLLLQLGLTDFTPENCETDDFPQSF